MDNEEPIVWHEPILDRYWDLLETKIDRMRQLDRVPDISGIQITNVEMKKERLAALVAIFRSGRATNSSMCLDFDNANLCEEGIVSLSKLVDVSSELQYLYLFHNRIDNMDSACCLSRSIKSHIQLNHLSLKHCGLGGNPEILSVILQSDISFINLQNNNIDSLGAVKIAEYLGSDPPIQRIDLEKNRLIDDDAILISQALKRNTNLKIIHLKGNNFTSIGVTALLNCVFDSSSLNAISESNHTLLSMFIFSRTSNIILQDCIDKLLTLDRTQKIFLALQDKDCLLNYLANVPVELIPEVLEFTRWVDDQPLNKHLNIFYSTMRRWNMPMLYSFRSCVKSDTKRKRSD
jgi:Ran GTPase-activating protein (RanGAP) involved in mRNA processing and transport